MPSVLSDAYQFFSTLTATRSSKTSQTDAESMAGISPELLCCGAVLQDIVIDSEIELAYTAQY